MTCWAISILGRIETGGLAFGGLNLLGKNGGRPNLRRHFSVNDSQEKAGYADQDGPVLGTSALGAVSSGVLQPFIVGAAHSKVAAV